MDFWRESTIVVIAICDDDDADDCRGDHNDCDDDDLDVNDDALLIQAVQHLRKFSPSLASSAVWNVLVEGGVAE